MQLNAGDSILSIQPFLALEMQAKPFIESLGWLTNSIFVAVIVTLLILWFVRKATKNVKRVPSGMQNFVEYVIEFLYGQVEGIVGKHVAPKAFPFSRPSSSSCWRRTGSASFLVWAPSVSVRPAAS